MMDRKSTTTLFSNGWLHETLEAHIKKAKGKVDEISREKFLASSDDLIFEYVKADLFVNALSMQEDS